MKDHQTELQEMGLYIGLVLAKYLFGTEYMHYGYWTEDLPVQGSHLLQAQENYTDLIMSQIPDGVRTVLDVGCGGGRFAAKLLNAGYQVDAVSPSPLLSERARTALGEKGFVYECPYEEIRCDKTYDMILFCESFQYIPMEQALEISHKLLNDGGHLLICDFFKKEGLGKSPIGGGHGLTKFYETVAQFPYQPMTDRDITKETAPNMDIMNDLLMHLVFPIWRAIAEFMKNTRPRISKMVTWKFRKNIEKVHSKYFSQIIKGESFAQFKSYRLLVYRKAESFEAPSA